jgi:hypothetical protein
LSSWRSLSTWLLAHLAPSHTSFSVSSAR